MVDYSNIVTILMTYNVLKLMKLIINVMNCGYFFGLGWILCCKLLNSKDSTYNFLNYADYDLAEASDSRICIVGIYFAFTSLSTVGFGDYTPRSDIERLLGAVLMLSGVAIFSTIMEQMIDMFF